LIERVDRFVELSFVEEFVSVCERNIRVIVGTERGGVQILIRFT
jgi:hypothetical protein